MFVSWASGIEGEKIAENTAQRKALLYRCDGWKPSPRESYALLSNSPIRFSIARRRSTKPGSDAYMRSADGHHREAQVIARLVDVLRDGRLSAEAGLVGDGDVAADAHLPAHDDIVAYRRAAGDSHLRHEQAVCPDGGPVPDHHAAAELRPLA